MFISTPWLKSWLPEASIANFQIFAGGSGFQPLAASIATLPVSPNGGTEGFFSSCHHLSVHVKLHIHLWQSLDLLGLLKTILYGVQITTLVLLFPLIFYISFQVCSRKFPDRKCLQATQKVMIFISCIKHQWQEPWAMALLPHSDSVVPFLLKTDICHSSGFISNIVDFFSSYLRPSILKRCSGMWCRMSLVTSIQLYPHITSSCWGSP